MSSATARPSSRTSSRKNSRTFSRSPSTVKLCAARQGIRAATNHPLKNRPIEFCRRVPLWLASVGECGTIEAVLGGTAGHRDARLGGLHLFQNGAYRLCFAMQRPSAKCRQALTDLEQSHFATLCPRNLRFGSPSHNRNETTFRRAIARIVKSGPATGFTTTAMTRFPLALNSETTSAGFQPKLLALFRSRSSTLSPRWFATHTAWGERKRTITSSNSFSSR